jgi:hypothetical protein
MGMTASEGSFDCPPSQMPAPTTALSTETHARQKWQPHSAGELRFERRRGRSGDLENGSGGRSFNRRNEPVPLARECLHVARVVRRVTERLTKLIDGRIETLFEVDECRALPQVTLQFVPGDDLSGPVYQNGKNLERLSLKPQAGSVLCEPARTVVILERTEQHFERRARLRHHTRIEIVPQTSAFQAIPEEGEIQRQIYGALIARSTRVGIAATQHTHRE